MGEPRTGVGQSLALAACYGCQKLGCLPVPQFPHLPGNSGGAPWGLASPGRGTGRSHA